MSDINPQFIDVDFTKDPRYVFGDLSKVRTFGSSAPSYEDVVPEIPESQWRDLEEKMTAEDSGADKLVSRIYDQGQEGSCVANACCQAHEIVQALQHGIENVIHLAAISLYKRIGTSAQSGAMVEDGIDEMVKGGVLPLDTPENRARFGNMVMPNTGFRTPYPSGHEAVMKTLLALEWHPIRSVGGIMTAGFNRHPVVVGRQGHSICYARPKWKDKWLYKYANSWHESWGENGFGYDTMSQIRQSAQWAFALRAVMVNLPS